MNSVKTKTQLATPGNYRPLPARGNLHGMTVAFKGTWDSETVLWTVLDRHPTRGHWWLHRRDELGVWVTTFARYTQLVQVIE